MNEFSIEKKMPMRHKFNKAWTKYTGVGKESVLGNPQPRCSPSLIFLDNGVHPLLCKRITLLKHRFLGPTPRFLDSGGLRLGLWICITNNFPGEADTPGPGTTLWETALYCLYSNSSRYICNPQKECSVKYLHCKIMTLQVGSEYMLEKRGENE